MTSAGAVARRARVNRSDGMAARPGHSGDGPSRVSRTSQRRRPLATRDTGSVPPAPPRTRARTMLPLTGEDQSNHVWAQSATHVFPALEVRVAVQQHGDPEGAERVPVPERLAREAVFERGAVDVVVRNAGLAVGLDLDPVRPGGAHTGFRRTPRARTSAWVCGPLVATSSTITATDGALAVVRDLAADLALGRAP